MFLDWVEVVTRAVFGFYSIHLKLIFMQFKKTWILFILAAPYFFSCVSRKKLESAESSYDTLMINFTTLQGALNKCNEEKTALQQQKTSLESNVANLNKQIDFLKQNNTQALKQLEDLSVITSSQAESIRKSLENIGAKDTYIQTLQQQMARKDSLNMVLVMNLKGAIGNLNDQDINIRSEERRVGKEVIFEWWELH